MSSLYYGHLGRAVMLRNVANIWWPKIHRELVNMARYSKECMAEGENVEVFRKQSKFGKLAESTELNEEVALGFPGPFQTANYGKNDQTRCFYINRQLGKL